MTVSYARYDSDDTKIIKERAAFQHDRSCDLCRNTVFLREDSHLQSEEGLEKWKIINLFFGVRKFDRKSGSALHYDDWKTNLYVLPDASFRGIAGFDGIPNSNLMCLFFYCDFKIFCFI